MSVILNLESKSYFWVFLLSASLNSCQDSDKRFFSNKEVGERKTFCTVGVTYGDTFQFFPQPTPSFSRQTFSLSPLHRLGNKFWRKRRSGKRNPPSSFIFSLYISNSLFSLSQKAKVMRDSTNIFNTYNIARRQRRLFLASPYGHHI